MDCVVGRQGVDKQAILTILFRRTNFQLMLLLEEKTSKNVVTASAVPEGLPDIPLRQGKRILGP